MDTMSVNLCNVGKQLWPETLYAANITRIVQDQSKKDQCFLPSKLDQNQTNSQAPKCRKGLNV